ncbi:MAG: hypothetical protein IJ345_05175 [Clostridia bacterium]|nr:hypothetical protein [Clostridia bacterium]
MKRDTIKKAINWFGILIAAHVGGMIIYELFLSNSLSSIVEDEPNTVSLSIFIFNIAFQIFFSALFVNLETTFVEYRRKMREALRESSFSTVEYFKQRHLNEDLIKLAIFTVFQIPFVIFYGSFKLSLFAMTGLERFYIMDAGAYVMTGSAILGFLLNTLLFGIIYLSVRLASLALLKKRI